jgi:2,3-bisphosphoglycerate-independent phosphoglycerate mutase
MIGLEQIKGIAISSKSKIVLLALDGLGGLPYPRVGKTELEAAQTPNLDRLAGEGICGLIDPISSGITSGSGPGHLALFGYDPLKFTIGRGVLEALGIDFKLEDEDIAVRGNFCTVNDNGLVTDRRAGRISTEKCTELCQKLSQINIDGVQLSISPVEGHRFIVVFRGDNLSPELSDSDPQQIGIMPHDVVSLSTGAKKTAGLANEFIVKAKAVLVNSQPANMVLLRGFSQRPRFPLMSEVYKLKPAAIATYPMYRGIAKLVGMDIIRPGASIHEEFVALSEHYSEYNFFFLHIKQTDTAGEDGDFWRKVRAIEEVDTALPQLINLQPEVVVVTGDHSTPAAFKGHSWHPVPFLLYSQWCRPDEVTEFSEQACAKGSLGRFPALEIMPLALANALKLTKFGA